MLIPKPPINKLDTSQFSDEFYLKIILFPMGARLRLFDPMGLTMGVGDFVQAI